MTFLVPCDYCSAPLPVGHADLACDDCYAKIADAAQALHAEREREDDEARRDAELDAAQLADPVEREALQAEDDLHYEYSGPEYDDYDDNEWAGD